MHHTLINCVTLARYATRPWHSSPHVARNATRADNTGFLSTLRTDNRNQWSVTFLVHLLLCVDAMSETKKSTKLTVSKLGKSALKAGSQQFEDCRNGLTTVFNDTASTGNTLSAPPQKK